MFQEYEAICFPRLCARSPFNKLCSFRLRAGDTIEGHIHERWFALLKVNTLKFDQAENRALRSWV